MATWLDDSIGAVLSRLEALDLTENTLVILASDHGNRGKESVYEAARSPMIIRWPAQLRPHSVSHALVGNIDIAATILDAVGDSPEGLDGKSFLPLLRGETDQHRDSLMLEMSVSRALVTERWKYIANRPPPEIAAAMRQ